MIGRKRNSRNVAKRYRNPLKRMRFSHDCFTQKELSRRTGIPRSSIGAIESQKLFLSAPYALLIKEEFNCSLDELYERKAGV